MQINEAKNENENEALTQNVRQRTYAVTTMADPKPILRTGNIGTCVAFYGIHPEKNVAFMCHVDGKVNGIGGMLKELEVNTGGDLKGFSLYCTPKWTIRARVGILALYVLLLYWRWGSIEPRTKFLGVAVLIVFLWIAFLSLVMVFWVARWRFGQWVVKSNPAPSHSVTVEASVDARQGSHPVWSHDEEIGLKERERRYGVLDGHCWCEDMRPMPKDQEQGCDNSDTYPDDSPKHCIVRVTLALWRWLCAVRWCLRKCLK